ncbi:unnamed protein product [Rhodiola kirilowii]
MAATIQCGRSSSRKMIFKSIASRKVAVGLNPNIRLYRSWCYGVHHVPLRGQNCVCGRIKNS